MSKISPLAFVHPQAKIADDVQIDPFVFIDADVEIGSGCIIMSHASVIGGTKIGKNTKLYDGCVVGADPQDFRWRGERGRCEVGDNVHIYQHVIINRSIHTGASTVIGDNSYIMAQSHIGHDSSVGQYCVIGNGAKIAGDCKVDDYSILSSGAIVHERCQIGKWVLVKGGCRVNNNVPPYSIMAHNPISYYGVNAFILRKGKMSEDRIDDIAKCYRHIYQCGTSLFNAMRRIQEDVTPGPEREAILTFIRDHGMKIAALNTDLLD